MTASAEVLLPKTKAFSLDVIRLCGELPQGPISDVLTRQVLRSATSVGAHVREGKRSRSIAEMISKAEVALQELEETIYWLELLTESGLARESRTSGMLRQADMLMAMLVTGVKSLKRR